MEHLTKEEWLDRVNHPNKARKQIIAKAKRSVDEPKVEAKPAKKAKKAKTEVKE